MLDPESQQNSFHKVKTNLSLNNLNVPNGAIGKQKLGKQVLNSNSPYLMIVLSNISDKFIYQTSVESK